MRVLVNASNIKAGGGVQVSDSIIRQLNQYKTHFFVVVLPPQLDYLLEVLNGYGNCCPILYSLPQSLFGIFIGKNNYLDEIVHKEKIDVVYTIFGPSLWRPKVKHLCGFARPQLIYRDSPFFMKMSIFQRLKSAILERVKLYNFSITSDYLVTENTNVTEILQTMLPKKGIYTVTNYYNQIFDDSDFWTMRALPAFDGITLLTISANHPHKNLGIINEVLKYIYENSVPINIRFVVTILPDEIIIDNRYKENIIFLGKVNITECPHLYSQSDIMFLPTLLECFTASYAEAMRMEVPIITSDLSFARSLCGDSALYFDPLSPGSIVEAICAIAHSETIKHSLINAGKQQLKQFDSHVQRCQKTIQILENIYTHETNNSRS